MQHLDMITLHISKYGLSRECFASIRASCALTTTLVSGRANTMEVLDWEAAFSQDLAARSVLILLATMWATPLLLGSETGSLSAPVDISAFLQFTSSKSV